MRAASSDAPNRRTSAKSIAHHGLHDVQENKGMPRRLVHLFELVR